MTDAFTPAKSDRFTFGLWTVGNRGRDPFGGETRPALPPVRAVEQLARLGAYGVSLHDNDLIPPGTPPQARDAIVREFRHALADWDIKVPMATVNLFSDPLFRNGALTSPSPAIRRYALDKARVAMDLAMKLGAGIFVLWGGREGCETDAGRDPAEALDLYREGLNELAAYLRTSRYPLRIALEAKPNEPRGDLYLPTTGAMLAFIATLDDPDRFGVNVEVAHEKMAGLNPSHAMAQALKAGRLLHVDLNDQRIARFDQDLRFGSDDLKGAFFVVKTLEDGGYDGPRHFDAHAYRTEDEEGVWAFARGCMRTYLILREKVERFRRDPEIQGLLQALKQRDTERSLSTPEGFRQAAELGYSYEQLDQLVVELLMGVR